MTPLQPLIDAASRGATINLVPGQYDDAAPVVIDKTLTIQGPREAIINSEIIISDGASVGFDGLKFEMNKVGAPKKTGVGSPYPQNGMIVLLNATMWMDDCSMTSSAGLSKPAIHCTKSFINVRSRTKLSNVDWRGNDAQVIELLYGCYANFFDVTGQNVGFGIASETSAANGAAITCVGSKMTLSGAHVYRFGTTDYGVSVARDGYCQVGAGLYTSVQFPLGVFVDATSRKWVAPGCVG